MKSADPYPVIPAEVAGIQAPGMVNHHYRQFLIPLCLFAFICG